MATKVDTVTAGAALLNQAADKWLGSGKGSIYALGVRVARKLSKDDVFNIACWLRYNYGPLVSGEEDQDWIKSAEDVLRIAGVKRRSK